MSENSILVFQEEGKAVEIQCKRSEKIYDIFKRFSSKAKEDIDSMYFLINGDKITDNVKLEKINNKDNKITVLVYKKDEEDDSDINDKNAELSKEIICPGCGENCLINFDDYIITLNKCDNKHSKNNILLNKYSYTQMIYESKIKCKNCPNTKSKSHNNIFYKCFTCNIDLCPLCKTKHDKKHIIVNYDEKNYLCHMHGQNYTSYCQECEKNVCSKCDINHNKDHNFVYYREIIKNQKKDNTNELKIIIDRFKNEIEDYIDKFKNILSNLDIYLNISNNINNNNYNNKNYQILMNINKINEYNEIVISNLNQIISENDIGKKFKYLSQMYEKMFNKEKFNKSIKIMKKNEKENEDEDDDSNNIIYETKMYERNKYVGETKNGKRHGKGTMYYDIGDIYVGDYYNDVKEGKGIYYHKNGDRYEGDYKNGAAEGKGIYYYRNGDREMGDYYYGEKVGKHVTLFANGEVKSNNYS